MIRISEPAQFPLRRLILFCLLTWLTTMPMIARGQADSAVDAGAPADSAAQSVIPTKSLLSIIKDGGYLMFPLLACSFTLLVFAFERAISLRRGRAIPRPFVKRFLHQLETGQLDKEQAILICA